MTSQEESLITPTEAEEIVAVPSGVAAKMRIPLMLILGTLLVVVATLLIMILLSLRGSRTGWESIFPSLDQNKTEVLQTN